MVIFICFSRIFIMSDHRAIDDGGYLFVNLFVIVMYWFSRLTRILHCRNGKLRDAYIPRVQFYVSWEKMSRVDKWRAAATS